jgi:hypothetical protein
VCVTDVGNARFFSRNDSSGDPAPFVPPGWTVPCPGTAVSIRGVGRASRFRFLSRLVSTRSLAQTRSLDARFLRRGD